MCQGCLWVSKVLQNLCQGHVPSMFCLQIDVQYISLYVYGSSIFCLFRLYSIFAQSMFHLRSGYITDYVSGMFSLRLHLRSVYIPSLFRLYFIYFRVVLRQIRSIYDLTRFPLRSVFVLLTLLLCCVYIPPLFRLHSVFVLFMFCLHLFTLCPHFVYMNYIINTFIFIVLPSWQHDHQCNHHHCHDGRYVACALP